VLITESLKNVKIDYKNVVFKIFGFLIDKLRMQEQRYRPVDHQA
jgi:hypothetical protein